MRLTRRDFLQQMGLMLTALGISDSLLLTRSRSALAQPTRRKLALLVGINQYPEAVCDYPARGSALSGCLTDVELQYELLVHRFGFQPADILILGEQQATRQAIVEGFQQHLVAQARPGDVVVFHFSGLGSRVALNADGTRLQNALVPFDGLLPTAENPFIHDWLEDTLGLLLRSLNTEQILTILDAGYTNVGRVLQGHLRIRSRPSAPSGTLQAAELALQDQLVQQTGVTLEQIQTQWRSGQMPGITLAAARLDQVATEAQWNGFSAGSLTYALTRYLWCTTPATVLRVSLARAASSMAQVVGLQQPEFSGQKLSASTLANYFPGTVPPTADGVVRSVEPDGKTGHVWLSGLPIAVLENSSFSFFALDVPAAGLAPTPSDSSAPESNRPSQDSSASPKSSTLLIQLRSHEGLKSRVRLINNTVNSAHHLESGQLIREAIRVLPRNIGLTIALDTNLERIERVDATSAFATIPKMTAIAAGEQSADYLFSKAPTTLTLTAALPAAPTTDTHTDTHTDTQPMLSPKSGYGLFHLDRDAIVSTISTSDEAVKTAIQRIAPELQTLLAIKLLRLTENTGSSRLGVRATLAMSAPQDRLVTQLETGRSTPKLPTRTLATVMSSDGLPRLPLGSRIQYRLSNFETSPLYFVLFGLNAAGQAIAFSSPVGTASGTASPGVIPPQDTIIVPQTNPSDWLIQGATGLAETYCVFSRSPFTATYAALSSPSAATNGQILPVTLLPVTNAIEVAQAILQDLHQASSTTLSKANTKLDIAPDSYALDVNTWATLSFIYQVTAAES